MKKLTIALVATTLFLSISAPMAAIESPSKITQEARYGIHVISMGKGDDLFSRFGHIALMVEDRKYQVKKVYNFGTFDFEDPDLQIKYARGFLNYWVSVVSYEEILYFYTMLDRDVFLQTLNVTPKEAEAIAKKLEINALPENRVYKYRHYIDNCCTRIRDIIDEETDGSLSSTAKGPTSDRDFRYWTRNALEGLPLFQSVILYSLGPAIDRPLTRWEEQFLPEVLREDLGKATYGPNKKPLVIKTQRLVERKGPTVEEIVPVVDYVVFSILGVLLLVGFGVPIIVGRKKWATRLAGMGLFVWGLLAGLGGLMLVLYWTATTHYDTHYNENLLVNPFLHLWLVGPGLVLLFKGRIKDKTATFISYYLMGAQGLIVIDLLLKIGPFIQNNYAVIVLAVLCNTMAFFALLRTGVVTLPTGDSKAPPKKPRLPRSQTARKKKKKSSGKK